MSSDGTKTRPDTVVEGARLIARGIEDFARGVGRMTEAAALGLALLLEAAERLEQEKGKGGE